MHVKAATILPLVGLASVKHNPFDRGQGAQYVKCRSTGIAVTKFTVRNTAFQYERKEIACPHERPCSIHN